MTRVFALLPALLLAAPALAEDENARRAREELEHQLHDLVRIPPPQLEVVFSGIDASEYLLEAATFTLDDQPLPVNEAELGPGKVLFSGTISPGPHTFASQLTYKEDPKTLFTYMAGTRFKIPGRAEFTAQRGLRLHLRAGVHVDASADLQHRLKPNNRLEPEMLAQVDDGAMPEAPRPRHVEAPDAGAAAAVAMADAAPPPALADAADEPAPTPHGKKGHSRKSTVPAVAHEERRVVAAKAVETQAPQPLSQDAGAPVALAMAAVPAAAAATALPEVAPATVVVEEEGMSLGVKLGIVAGVTLVALLGLTVFFRTRR